MLNIRNLKRQHNDIAEIVERINSRLTRNSVETYAMVISKDISILAGKIKIHLNEEDKWLYPTMEKSSDIKLLEFHKTYQDEMQDLLTIFNTYKSSFNTKSKILNNIDLFIQETSQILTALKNRIQKENNELYPLLASNS